MNGTKLLLKQVGVPKNFCILASGADMKSAFSFWKNNLILISGDYGDLSEPDNFKNYLAAIRKTARQNKFCPDIVAVDLHPAYFSRRVRDLFPSAHCFEVQHHHAHVATALALHPEEHRILGISFDGTGYGLDGNVWGGEFLLVSPSGMARPGHLEYLRMPGGEAAVRQPWRMAFSLLYSHLKDTVFSINVPCMKLRHESDYALLKTLMDKNINAPLTSSCGRLFDAVSSLLGIVHIATSEAEAAIRLQQEAEKSDDSKFYRFDLSEEHGVFIAGYGSFLECILGDIKRKVSVQDIARRFHNSIALLVAEVAERIRGRDGPDAVVLTGGVFQNKLLCTLAEKALKEKRFRLLNTEPIPVNDLGICAGQTYVALNMAGRNNKKRASLN